MIALPEKNVYNVINFRIMSTLLQNREYFVKAGRV